MPTVFPNALDDFGAKLVIDLEDALQAVEARLGITGSTVAGTVEKRLADIQAALDALETLGGGAVIVDAPGGVDDTGLVTSARAAAGPGGRIIFAPGTYAVSGLAASVENQHWIIPPGTIVKTKNGANTPTIDVTANGVTIDGGGTLDGNRVGQTNATTGLTSAVRIVSRSGVTVRNMVIRDSLSHAVYIDASSKIRIRNNEISGCALAGNHKQILVYDIVGSSSDIRISGNEIDSTGSTNGCIAITTAIAGRTIRKVRITGNHCKVGISPGADTLGIELFTSGTATITHATVSNNVVEGPLGVVGTDSVYGISIGGTASNAANGIHGVACGNNVIDRCPMAAVEIVGNGVTCTGNTATASGAFSINGVSTTGGLRGTTMVGNSSDGCVNLAYALFLEGGGNGLHAPVVAGNTVTGAASASVIATAGTITGAVISTNTVRLCTGVPLNLGGTFTDGTVSTNSFDLTGVGANIDGILIGSTGVTNNAITDNTIKGATRSGIHVIVATSHNTIQNNRIRGCQDGLKVLAAQDHWVVGGNKIRNCVDRGLIFFVASTNLLVSADNAVTNNPGGDYYYAAGTTFITAPSDVDGGTP